MASPAEPHPRGLFVMDLDGTLLDRDGRIAERNFAAMRRASSEGIALAIVTGRRRSTFRPERARFEGIALRASVSNGSVLLSADNETVERVHEISWSGFERACQMLPRRGIKACIAVTLPPVPAPGEPELPDALIFVAGRGFYHAASPWEPERQIASRQFAISAEAAMSRPLVHAAFHVANSELAAGLVPLIAEAYGKDALVYATPPPRAGGVLIDVLARGGKGLAIADLASSLRVSREAIAAIGDERNDLPLLE
ncbi:MAG: HAD family hydrolase, partial [Terracidiphilus sp.]